MSDKGFTDDEVRAAIATTEECKVYSNANRMTRGELDAISWAASEFLKAKAVIEWYGDEDRYKWRNRENSVMRQYPPKIFDDMGAKAREYLDSLNKS